MRSFRIAQSLRHSLRTSTPVPILKNFTRLSSTQAALYKELTSREPNYIFDYTTPMPSHLLNISLADFLPASCQPTGFDKNYLPNPSGAREELLQPLPQGHHLVYFPPQVPSSELLPDGTDPIQSPGEPFVRRMWAGGSLTFHHALVRDNERHFCEEKITDVLVKGAENKEKIFVTIERRIEEENPDGIPDLNSTLLVERRNLVFMKEKTAAAAKEDAARSDRILKRTQS
jgi:hypothetical protein